MSNRVGDNTPAKAEIEKMEQTVEKLIGTLNGFCVALLPEERQSLSRGRVGIEPHLARMAAVAKKFGFSVPGFSVDALQNDVRTASELARLEQLLEKAHQLVKDTRALARSEGVEAGLLVYGLAQAAAERTPELEVEVREMRAFMATGPRRRKEPEPAGK